MRRGSRSTASTSASGRSTDSTPRRSPWDATPCWSAAGSRVNSMPPRTMHLLVRVEKPSAVPLSSLHGRRDDVEPHAAARHRQRARGRRAGRVLVPAAAGAGPLGVRAAGAAAAASWSRKGASTRCCSATIPGAAAATVGSEQLRKRRGRRRRSPRSAARRPWRVSACGCGLIPDHDTVAVESAAGLLTDDHGCGRRAGGVGSRPAGRAGASPTWPTRSAAATGSRRTRWSPPAT